jgi:polyisoprenoid-binding protein YceI
MQTGTQRVLTPVRYLFDTSGSRFTVQAFSTGLLSMLGHDPSIGIRDYEGEVQFTPETYEGAYVRVAVHTGAMEVLDEIKSGDRMKIEQLMYESVLDVERFPTAVFESNAISVERQAGSALRARVNGELSFRGVSQPHSLDARVVNIGTMLRISGGFSLRQSDYGIKPISFAAGALRLKDEIKFNFEIVARMQELE